MQNNVRASSSTSVHIEDVAENMNLLKHAFEFLQEGVLIFDFNKNVRYVNPAFSKINGFNSSKEVEDLIHQHEEYTFFDENDNPLSPEQTPVQQLFSKEPFDHIFLKVRHKKNEWYGVFSGKVIESSEENFGMLSVQDVTFQENLMQEKEKLLLKDKERYNDLVTYKNRLQGESDLLQTIIDSIPVMITIYDPNIEHLHLNKAVEKITGWTKEDTEKTTIMELAYPDPAYRKEIATYMQSLKHGFKDIIMRTKSGNDIETSWANISIPDGRQVGIGIDISERKKAERELMESEEMFRSVIENAPMGMHMYKLEDDGLLRFIGANPAADKILGVDNSGYAGKSIEKAFPEIDNTEIPDKFREIAKEGGLWINHNILYMDNKISGAFENYNFRIAPNTMVSLFVDITERKEAEEAVRESEERFRTMADNISQFTWMTNEKGRIFWYNKRWYDYTGTTLEDMQRWGWTKVHHPDHIDRVVSHYKASIEAGKIWEDIFPLRGKNGNYRWFLSRALPIKDESGKIIRWFGTNTDITERKKMEEDLVNAMNVQNAFIQNVSHEVRTPMNSILGFTELLQRTINAGKEKDYLDAITHNGRHLTRLIDDIVDLSRLDKKQMSLVKKTVSLVETFEHTLQQAEGLKLSLQKNHVKFNINCPSAFMDVILETDINRLQQVISNFVSNAVKYTDDGSIELGCELDEPNKMVNIYVRDTGKGIAEENHHKVFKRFQQFDLSNTSSIKGTGLGLAICKHMVRLFGGEIGFTSTFGKGSTFYFTHPYVELRKLKQQKQADTNVTTNDTPDLSGKTLLIVEDEEFSFFMLYSILEDTGAEILHAANGREAIRFYDTTPIDFVFSDIRLPDMLGYEIIKHIRKEDDNLPVVALSANALPEEIEKSIQAGFDLHITKPVSIADLYGLLHKYLLKKERKV